MNFFLIILLQVVQVFGEGYYTVLENLLNRIVGHASALHGEFNENEQLMQHLVKYSLLANAGTLSLVIFGGIIMIVLYRRIKTAKETAAVEMSPLV